MFRKTNQFDTARIQEHIAAIKFLADTLLLTTQRHHVSSHLSVLLNAIETFEKHRFSDYTFNKTKRAQQVLNTRKIFNELYKHQLKQSNASIVANALKMELKDYASSVKSHIKSVQADLTSSLTNRFDTALIQQEIDLLNKDMDLLCQEAAAYSLADRVASLQESDEENVVSEDEYEFFVTEPVSEDELSDKPYLQGSFNSDSDSESDSEYEQISDSESEDEYVSECDSDREHDFDNVTSDVDSNDSETQQLQSPAIYRHYSRGWLNRPWLNNSDAEDSSSDEEEMDNRPTEHRFSS